MRFAPGGRSCGRWGQGRPCLEMARAASWSRSSGLPGRGVGVWRVVASHRDCPSQRSSTLDGRASTPPTGYDRQCPWSMWPPTFTRRRPIKRALCLGDRDRQGLLVRRGAALPTSACLAAWNTPTGTMTRAICLTHCHEGEGQRCIGGVRWCENQLLGWVVAVVTLLQRWKRLVRRALQRILNRACGCSYTALEYV